MTTYKPTYLKPWTLPASYAGAHWDGYFSFLGQSRDSDCLERSNFDAGLKAIGGQLKDFGGDDEEFPLVKVVRENHWAVGWVEWIAIHETAFEQLAIADKIKEKLEDYPVVDEELWSQYETEEANEVWKNCYRPKERLEYIRQHRSQFDFSSLSDLLGCVRGNYFAGYASELLN